MILKSREKYQSSDEFKKEFLETITPGVIKRGAFIHWETIAEKIQKYTKFFNFFKQIEFINREDCINKISDSLLAADKPMEIIKTSFELLGHTGQNYVSDEDYIDFKAFGGSELIEENTIYIAQVLVDLGICNVLNLELEDYFTGVQVGLETHRRKNVGGVAFYDLINKELAEMVFDLNKEGHEITLKQEEKILFEDKKTSKKVDFCLHYRKQSIGIEVNFYTAAGSKPTEIKRSYGHVNKELEKVKVTLAWITDGIGYKEMQNSLKEARDIHKNIYNYRMLKKDFRKDVEQLFGIKSAC